MGLLEDLERQAEEQRRLEELGSAEMERRKAYFQSTVRPAVGRIYEYAKELTDTINYLKRENEVRFELPRYGPFTVRIRPEWRIRVSKDDEQASITVETLSEVSKDAPEVTMDTPARVKDMKSILVESGVAAREDVKRDGRGNPAKASFRVQGTIRRLAEVSCRSIDEDILFEFTNLGRLGESHRRHKAEVVDDEFLDRFGRFLIGEDEDFLKEVRDEADVNRIRQQIRRQSRTGAARRERDDHRSNLLEHLRDLWHKPE